MVDKIVSSFFLFLSLSCNPSSYAVDDSAEQEHPNLQVSASLINKSIQIYTYQPPSKESFFYSYFHYCPISCNIWEGKMGFNSFFVNT